MKNLVTCTLQHPSRPLTNILLTTESGSERLQRMTAEDKAKSLQSETKHLAARVTCSGFHTILRSIFGRRKFLADDRQAAALEEFTKKSVEVSTIKKRRISR